MAESDRTKIEAFVKEFAESEVEEIARWKSMTEEQTAALAAIGSGGPEPVILRALQTLYGVADGRAMQVVAKMCESGNVPSVRKAAAGCLGLSGNPGVVTVLAAVAIGDESPDVRLEAYLALDALGTSDARDRLADARRKWSSDAYFREVQQVSVSAS